MDRNNLPEDILGQKERDHALYFIEDGEEGFSPEHNAWVVAESIRKTNLNRAIRNKLYKDAVGERVDAVITYIRSRAAEGTTPIEKYFGKKQLAHLRGQQIVSTIQTKLRGRNRKIYLPQ